MSYSCSREVNAQSFYRRGNMANKPVDVDRHKRSTPSTPAWEGPGNKPGPKSVDVDKHKRSKPTKK
jgi:hypothetical protein